MKCKNRIGICKGCGIEYNRDNVARVYGAESSVFLGNYHSAECYTAAITKEFPEIDKEKGLIEICGSVVPMAELERVWKIHCTTTSPSTQLHTEEWFTISAKDMYYSLKELIDINSTVLAIEALERMERYDVAERLKASLLKCNQILKKANPNIEFKSPPQSLIDKYMEKWDLPQ